MSGGLHDYGTMQMTDQDQCFGRRWPFLPQIAVAAFAAGDEGQFDEGVAQDGGVFEQVPLCEQGADLAFGQA